MSGPRVCVVCGARDQVGKWRKSGWKCKGCVGSAAPRLYATPESAPLPAGPLHQPPAPFHPEGSSLGYTSPGAGSGLGTSICSGGAEPPSWVQPAHEKHAADAAGSPRGRYDASCRGDSSQRGRYDESYRGDGSPRAASPMKRLKQRMKKDKSGGASSPTHHTSPSLEAGFGASTSVAPPLGLGTDRRAQIAAALLTTPATEAGGGAVGGAAGGPPQEPTMALAMLSEQGLRAMFDAIDSDGSGTLDRKEIAAVFKKGGPTGFKLPTMEIDAVLDEMDGDGGGDIDFAEFCSWMTSVRDGGKKTKSDPKAELAALREKEEALRAELCKVEERADEERGLREKAEAEAARLREECAALRDELAEAARREEELRNRSFFSSAFGQRGSARMAVGGARAPGAASPASPARLSPVADGDDQRLLGSGSPRPRPAAPPAAAAGADDGDGCCARCCVIA